RQRPVQRDEVLLAPREPGQQQHGPLHRPPLGRRRRRVERSELTRSGDKPTGTDTGGRGEGGGPTHAPRLSLAWAPFAGGPVGGSGPCRYIRPSPLDTSACWEAQV